MGGLGRVKDLYRATVNISCFFIFIHVSPIKISFTVTSTSYISSNKCQGLDNFSLFYWLDIYYWICMGGDDRLAER